MQFGICLLKCGRTFFLLSSFEVRLDFLKLNLAVSKICYLDKYSWFLFTFVSSGKVRAIRLDKFWLVESC